MAIPIDHASASLRFLQVGDNEEMVTTFGFTSTTLPIGQAHADAITAVTENVIVPTMRDIVTFVGTTIYVGSDGGSLVYESPSGELGDVTAETLPSNCALLVRKTTASAGRANRGRMFVPGCLKEAQVSANGNILSGELATLQTAYTNFLAQLGGASPDITMEILHTDPLVSPTVVTSLVVDAKIATQRQRMRR